MHKSDQVATPEDVLKLKCALCGLKKLKREGSHFNQFDEND